MCVSYKQNIKINKDPMIHKYDHYHSTLEITFSDYIQNLLSIC